jgi:hypothetical protein
MAGRAKSKANVLDTRPLEVPRFTTGEVAEIVQVPIWRLQKFLDSPRYQLSPAGQLGKRGGKGSRRLFSLEDVYRIGVAARIVGDGFSPKFVARALEFIDDRDLIDVDEEGKVISVGILFRRGGKGRPQLDLFPSGNPPKLDPKGPVYYVLDLGVVIASLDPRIAKVVNKRRRR